MSLEDSNSLVQTGWNQNVEFLKKFHTYHFLLVLLKNSKHFCLLHFPNRNHSVIGSGGQEPTCVLNSKASDTGSLVASLQNLGDLEVILVIVDADDRIIRSCDQKLFLTKILNTSYLIRHLAFLIKFNKSRLLTKIILY